MENRELREMLDQGWSLERIGKHAGKNPATASYWMKKYGLEAVNKEKHASRAAISREELNALVDCGLSITELAAELDRSKATVRHWLARHGLETFQTVRRANAEKSWAGHSWPIQIRQSTW
jgi:IS30 family transposase